MKINELHEELFKMLCWFDDVCKKENITYFLDSGTLIGAIREHDFIAWDDDIDLTMKRKDYIKFRKVVRKYLPNDYRFIEPKDFSPYVYDFFPRVINTTVCIRKASAEDKAYHGYTNKASIDIILLDNAPDNFIQQKIMKFKTMMYQGMCISKRYAVDMSKYSLFGKVLATALITIGKPFSGNNLRNLYQNNLMSYFHKNTNTYIYGTTVLRELKFHPKSIFNRSVNVEFHGREFPCPVGYDQLLTSMYGDYMTPVHDPSLYNQHNDFIDI